MKRYISLFYVVSAIIALNLVGCVSTQNSGSNEQIIYDPTVLDRFMTVITPIDAKDYVINSSFIENYIEYMNNNYNYGSFKTMDQLTPEEDKLLCDLYYATADVRVRGGNELIFMHNSITLFEWTALDEIVEKVLFLCIVDKDGDIHNYYSHNFINESDIEELSE